MSGVIPTIPRTHRVRTSDGFWRRRSGLIVPAVMLAMGVALIVGTITMAVPATAAPPGPQLFPAIIAVAVIVLAVLLAVDILRRPEPIDVADADADTDAVTPGADAEIDDDALLATLEGREPEAPAVRPRSNLRAMLGAVGTVIVFIAALTPLGWLLSGAFLFWGIARSLGSRRPVFDIFLSLAISALVQIAFSGGLGLNLPPGILEGLF